MNNQSAFQPGKQSNRSMPPGTIIPELVYDNLDEAVKWLCDTLGFQERLRIGNHRSQLVFGEASIVVVGRNTTSTNRMEAEKEVTHSLMVRVENVDQHYMHVKEQGGKITTPPATYPYGERQYTIEDIAGRRWTFSQSITDADPEVWGGKLILSYKEIT